MWEVFVVFLEENAVVISSLGGLAGVAALVTGVLKWPFRKAKPTQLADETIAQIKPSTPVDTAALTVPQFIAIRREMKADLEQELTTAHEDEKAELRARIAELQSQIDAPDEALADAQKTIADLTARLARMGNDVGGDRLAEAEAALAKLDFTVADAIFAEVEERQRLEVQKAARAAFGRGEVAEAEIRWHDAAVHYARAARLDPNCEALYKATQLAFLSGDYTTMMRHADVYLETARDEGESEEISRALDRKATALQYLGEYSEAENLFREAVSIEEKRCGNSHAEYAEYLNNLAMSVKSQGRFKESENLFRSALEVSKFAFGPRHKEYANNLNNLAAVVEDLGRNDEAEMLYRKALAIDETTIGTAHPDYAIRLNNLAGAVQAQGRYEEAEGLYREALAIDEATIGKAHPSYAIHLGNLAQVLAQKGEVDEARAHLNDAMRIFEVALPAEHPYIAEVQSRLDALPSE